MTEIVWGPEIAVDGKRPEWLEISDFPSGSQGFARTSWGWVGNRDRSDPIEEWAWSSITHIRLPADHPHYAQLSGISGQLDWSKPIEAVHEDGRVVPVALRKWHRGGQMHDSPDDDGDYYTTGNFEWSAVWNADGRHWMGEGRWRIRNVAQAPETPHPAPSPSEVGPEVVAVLVEALAAMLYEATNGDADCVISSDTLDEARGALARGRALLPEPVDADEAEVQFILHRWEENELETTEDAVREALKRGRALASEGK